MSRLAKVIGKNGILTAAAVDLAGILVSFLIDANITNTMLAKLVFLTYCVRYELIVLLFLLGFVYLCVYIYTAAPDGERRGALLTLLVPVLLGLSLAASPLLHYAKARYFYFNRQLYQYEAQKKYIKDAVAHYENNQWDACLEDLRMAQAFYPQNRFVNHLTNEMTANIQFVNAYTDNLYDLYIRPAKMEITYESFHCAHMLSELNPEKYGLLFDDYFAQLMDAETAYPDLYKAVRANDYQASHVLIIQHGRFWFEPTLYARFSYDNERYIMPLLHQYLENEDINDGIERIETYWLGEDRERTFAANYEEDEEGK